MGWLTVEQQKEIRRKYKVDAAYLCDHCKLPIFDAPLVDVNGGFYKWPKHLPNTCRHFLSREPKVTYHTKPCGLQLFNKTARKNKFFQDVAVAADRILQRISKQKPKGYWTKEKVFSHYQNKLEPKIIKKALTLLRKEKKIRRRKGGYEKNIQKASRKES